MTLGEFRSDCTCSDCLCVAKLGCFLLGFMAGVVALSLIVVVVGYFL